jgi:glycosyltransferase involved in cell wall biosynthesis
MRERALLMPVYNNQLGLERSLRSLKEARGGFDIVIVDDGSPQAIVVSSQLREDIGVYLLRLERNGGIAKALNHGLHHILERGYRYVARLDAGDTVDCKRFDRQVDALDRNRACAVVGSFIEFVDANQERLFCYRAPSAHHKLVQSLHINNCILHSGAMIRAAALAEVGFYSEDHHGAEDYELFLRMSRRYELQVIPELLTRCEYGLEGLSVAGRRSQQRTRLRLQLQYFDLGCWRSYYGVARTLLALLAPHLLMLRLKVAFGRIAARSKPQPELAP